MAQRPPPIILKLQHPRAEPKVPSDQGFDVEGTSFPTESFCTISKRAIPAAPTQAYFGASLGVVPPPPCPKSPSRGPRFPTATHSCRGSLEPLPRANIPLAADWFPAKNEQLCATPGSWPPGKLPEPVPCFQDFCSNWEGPRSFRPPARQNASSVSPQHPSMLPRGIGAPRASRCGAYDPFLNQTYASDIVPQRTTDALVHDRESDCRSPRQNSRRVHSRWSDQVPGAELRSTSRPHRSSSGSKSPDECGGRHLPFGASGKIAADKHRKLSPPGLARATRALDALGSPLSNVAPVACDGTWPEASDAPGWAGGLWEVESFGRTGVGKEDSIVHRSWRSSSSSSGKEKDRAPGFHCWADTVEAPAKPFSDCNTAKDHEAIDTFWKLEAEQQELAHQRKRQRDMRYQSSGGRGQAKLEQTQQQRQYQRPEHQDQQPQPCKGEKQGSQLSQQSFRRSSAYCSTWAEDGPAQDEACFSGRCSSSGWNQQQSTLQQARHRLRRRQRQWRRRQQQQCAYDDHKQSFQLPRAPNSEQRRQEPLLPPGLDLPQPQQEQPMLLPNEDFHEPHCLHKSDKSGGAPSLSERSNYGSRAGGQQQQQPGSRESHEYGDEEVAAAVDAVRGANAAAVLESCNHLFLPASHVGSAAVPVYQYEAPAVHQIQQRHDGHGRFASPQRRQQQTKQMQSEVHVQRPLPEQAADDYWASAPDTTADSSEAAELGEPAAPADPNVFSEPVPRCVFEPDTVRTCTSRLCTATSNDQVSSADGSEGSAGVAAERYSWLYTVQLRKLRRQQAELQELQEQELLHLQQLLQLAPSESPRGMQLPSPQKHQALRQLQQLLQAKERDRRLQRILMGRQLPQQQRLLLLLQEKSLCEQKESQDLVRQLLQQSREADYLLPLPQQQARQPTGQHPQQVP